MIESLYVLCNPKMEVPDMRIGRSVLDLRYDVVASVSNGEAAVTAAARLTPELILLDISMPGVNGFEAARQIKRASSVTSIIFVSEHEQKSYVEA